MPHNHTQQVEEIVERLSKKYGKDYEVESEPENYIHKGLNNAEFLSHFRSDLREALTTLIQDTEKAEWKRCVDVLDFDHSKCSIKETCIGYQNAQSDLMNNPPSKE